MGLRDEMKMEINHRQRVKWLILPITLTLLFVMIPYPSPACQYSIDEERSYAEFRLESREGSRVEGMFEGVSGQFLHDEERPLINTFLIRIDAGSVSTVPAVYKNLFWENGFFDAGNHPFILFESEWYCDSLKKGMLEGKLAIRGVKRKVVFHLKKKGEKHVPGEGDRISLLVTGGFDLRDFGLQNSGLAHDSTMQLRLWVDGLRE